MDEPLLNKGNNDTTIVLVQNAHYVVDRQLVVDEKIADGQSSFADGIQGDSVRRLHESISLDLEPVSFQTFKHRHQRLIQRQLELSQVDGRAVLEFPARPATNPAGENRPNILLTLQLVSTHFDCLAQQKRVQKFLLPWIEFKCLQHFTHLDLFCNVLKVSLSKEPSPEEGT